MSINKVGGKWVIRWWDELGAPHQHTMRAGQTKEEAASRLRDELVRIDRIKAGLEVRSRNPQRLTVADVAKRYEAGADSKVKNAIKCHITSTPIGAEPIDRVT